jgi:ribosomal protein S27AE
MDRMRYDEISAALAAKEAKGQCARCGRGAFAVLGESSIDCGDRRPEPVAVLACSHCGQVVQHALRYLGVSS